MAAAVATPSITFVDNTEKLTRIFGTIAITASPATYTTGGIACSFAGFDAIKSGQAPLKVEVSSQPAVASAAAAKFVYQFLPGATSAKGVLQVFTGAAAQSGLAELSAAAVPSGVSGDTLFFEALFQRV